MQTINSQLKTKFKKSLIMVWRNQVIQHLIIFIFYKFEKFSGYHYEKIRFKKKTGYYPNIKNPRSFNEKIVWKKIYDRNYLLPILADKYRVRAYIKEVLGEKESEKILIPLLYVTDNPGTIPFKDLPDEYIVKANHGSGTNMIVEKNKPINYKEIYEICKKWMDTPYGAFKHEWAYQNIKRKIVIEKLLRDEIGKIPTDYKFHMMHGRCVMVQVIWGRQESTKESLFDLNWNLIDETLTYPKGGYVEKPSNLKHMLKLAYSLSKNIDYIRVDLYSINNKIYFGELTCYPGSGALPKPSSKFDFELGGKWEIY